VASNNHRFSKQALLNLMKGSGESFTLAYRTYLIMADASLPMWRIVRFLNQPTDEPGRKAANRVRRKRGEEVRTKLREEMAVEGSSAFSDGVPVVDRMSIQIGQVGFRFPGSDADTLHGITYEIQQGSLVTILGQPASGKGIFMELLGGVYEQQIGSIFFPPHLRVLHVSRHVSVLAGSVLDNLFFGLLPVQATRENLDEQMFNRGMKICQRLKFPERLFALAQVFGDNNVQNLSRSDRKLIHLARAFIYNPEVLVVHTPGMYFDFEQRITVVELLNEFVRCRGIEMDDATRAMRRKRTCALHLHLTGRSVSGTAVAENVSTRCPTSHHWDERA
jgi:energy-coupling factor transporter ATP-binding protein EcfA2